MKKIEEILQAYQNYEPNKVKVANKELVEKFLNSPIRHAFGMNPYTVEIAKKLRIDCLTDSKAQSNGELYNSIPVCALDDVPKDAVIFCITLKSYNTIVCLLKEKGFNFTISLRDLFHYDKRYNIRFIENLGEDFAQEIRENVDRYENVYNELNDGISKKAFENVILHRLTLEPRFLEGYCGKYAEQYFEDFLYLKEEGEVFVDCGSYNGATSDMFIKKCPKYAYIYIYEPLDEIENAKNLLKGHKNIEFIKKGLWDKSEILKFNVDADNAYNSAIADQGDMSVEVVKMDETISRKTTFIKVDIEGAELNALIGAEKIIKRDRPKLAVCVYHKHDDFWQIFEYVKSIMPDYKVYLRHYSKNFCETVMFFV